MLAITCGLQFLGHFGDFEPALLGRVLGRAQRVGVRSGGEALGIAR